MKFERKDVSNMLLAARLVASGRAARDPLTHVSLHDASVFYASEGMRVKVRLFGQLREVAKMPDEEWREVRAEGSVEDLLAAIRAEEGIPEALLRVSAIAINGEYARPERMLRDGDEVAILPPVSGGRR